MAGLILLLTSGIYQSGVGASGSRGGQAQTPFSILAGLGPTTRLERRSIVTVPGSGKSNTYYLAPASGGGDDSNSGQSPDAPWRSPNHAIRCGDVIIARAGLYNNSDFYTGKWGRVQCSAGNNVAWLVCETFDACKIHATANQGMWVDQSYWGVEGWEISTSASDLYGTCFMAQPNWDHPAEIHHILFANDVANGCSQSGFAVVNHGAVGVDYFVVVGSIAYNAAQGSGTCTSGISIWQPVQSDSAPGTHLYIAGNFSYANIDPPVCDGAPPTDGEGIIFDTFDGRQGHLPVPYAAQAVAENNIVVGNGGKGIEVTNNAQGPTRAAIYIHQNTSWGNLTDPHQAWSGCGELALTEALGTQITRNLVATNRAQGCTAHPIFAIAVAGGGTSDSVTDNFIYVHQGSSTFVSRSGSFSLGKSNIVDHDPAFTRPAVPGAPHCQGASNAVACMQPLISAFVPAAAAAKGFGYQPPGHTPVINSLFPHWLCNVNLPAGLITPACQRGG